MCFSFSILTLFQPKLLFGFIYSIDIDDGLADSGQLDLEDGDGSDEDFVPSIHLRYVPP